MWKNRTRDGVMGVKTDGKGDRAKGVGGTCLEAVMSGKERNEGRRDV